MAYQPTIWKNREVERPRTFTIQNNPDGTVTLIPAEGKINEPGTPIMAVNLNKIEDELVRQDEAVTTHLDKTVASEEGAHGLRYFNEKLEIDNSIGWVEIPVGIKIKDYPTGHADELTKTGRYRVTGTTSELIDRGFPLMLPGAEYAIVEVISAENGKEIFQTFTWGRAARAYQFTRSSYFDTELKWNKWEQVLTGADIGTTSVTLFVDGSLGTDADGFGTGVGDKAYKTISYALERLPKNNLNPVQVRVAAGTYNEHVYISRQRISKITVLGAGPTTIIQKLSAADNSSVDIQSLKVKEGISLSANDRSSIFNCTLTDSFVGHGIEIVACPDVFIMQTTVSNHTGAGNAGIYAWNNSTVYLSTVSGTGNQTGILCQGSTVRKGTSVTITGTAVQQISGGGQIIT